MVWPCSSTTTGSSSMRGRPRQGPRRRIHWPEMTPASAQLRFPLLLATPTPTCALQQALVVTLKCLLAASTRGNSLLSARQEQLTRHISSVEDNSSGLSTATNHAASCLSRIEVIPLQGINLGYRRVCKDFFFRRSPIQNGHTPVDAGRNIWRWPG